MCETSEVQVQIKQEPIEIEVDLIKQEEFKQYTNSFVGSHVSTTIISTEDEDRPNSLNTLNKKRSPNFKPKELAELVKIVEKYSQIVECKKSDSTTWRSKQQAWGRIAKEFNATVGTLSRTANCLKIKYEGLKKNTKKKTAIIRREQCKIGGRLIDVPKLDHVEKKIQKLMYPAVVGPEKEADTSLDEILSEENTRLSEDYMRTPIYSMNTDLSRDGEESSYHSDNGASTSEETSEPQPQDRWNGNNPTILKTQEHLSLKRTLNESELNVHQKFPTKSLVSTASPKLTELSKTEKEDTNLDFRNQLLLENNERQKEEHELRCELLRQEHELKCTLLKEEHELKCVLLKEQTRETKIKCQMLEMKLGNID